MVKEILELIFCLLFTALFTVLTIKVTYKETKRICIISSFIWFVCTICKCATILF